MEKPYKTRLSRVGSGAISTYFSTYTLTKLFCKHFIMKQNKYSIMHQARTNCRQENSNMSHTTYIILHLKNRTRNRGQRHLSVESYKLVFAAADNQCSSTKTKKVIHIYIDTYHIYCVQYQKDTLRNSLEVTSSTKQSCQRLTLNTYSTSL